jgi:hypothetical protein
MARTLVALMWAMVLVTGTAQCPVREQAGVELAA